MAVQQNDQEYVSFMEQITNQPGWPAVHLNLQFTEFDIPVKVAQLREGGHQRAADLVSHVLTASGRVCQAPSR